MLLLIALPPILVLQIMCRNVRKTPKGKKKYRNSKHPTNFHTFLPLKIIGLV